MTPDVELDLSGLMSPMDMIRTAQQLKKLAKGDVLKVFLTATGTLKDIPQMCNQRHHELLDQWQDGDKFVFLIRK